MLAANHRSLAGWLVVVATAAAAALLFWPSAFAQEGEQELADSFAVESYAQNCSRCHGLDGQGGEVPTDGRPVPSLRNNDDLTVPYLDLVLLTGRMPPAGDPFDNRERHVFYDDAERQAMVEWMADEFDIPGEVPEVNEGEVSRGLEVFARNCAHCHGNAGAGVAVAVGAVTGEDLEATGDLALVHLRHLTRDVELVGHPLHHGLAFGVVVEDVALAVVERVAGGRHATGQEDQVEVGDGQVVVVAQRWHGTAVGRDLATLSIQAVAPRAVLGVALHGEGVRELLLPLLGEGGRPEQQGGGRCGCHHDEPPSQRSMVGGQHLAAVLSARQGGIPHGGYLPRTGS